MSTNTSPASENLSLASRKHEALLRSVRKGWTPPPRISVPDWADRYRKLAKEAGSTSGNWETTTVEIARGPMLAATESGVHIITVIHAGFQASKLFSPWQKDKPSDIAEKYLKAKGDPDKTQAWWNTQMGLPHRPNYGKRLPIDVLLARREVFDAEVPDGVAVLTAGIDTQNDRLEVEVVGWGMDEESWSIAFDVIEGDLETAEPWLRLDAYLKQIWRRADGRGFTIMAACHDSGGSHQSQRLSLRHLLCSLKRRHLLSPHSHHRLAMRNCWVPGCGC